MNLGLEEKKKQCVREISRVLQAKGTIAVCCHLKTDDSPPGEGLAACTVEAGG